MTNCCSKCESPLGYLGELHPCPCHSAEPTGAGMREKFYELFKDYRFHPEELPCFHDELVKFTVLKFFEAHIERLHSRIVERVEKRKTDEQMEELIWKDQGAQQEWYDGYYKAKAQDKDIINQAFKDLSN